VSGAILVDAGPIVAIFAEADEQHGTCVEQLRAIRGPILTCWPVIAEAAWLLQRYPGAQQNLLISLGGRPFDLLGLDATDLPGIVAILAKYEDLRIQLADACLVHLANREKIDTVFTLDRRDFSVMRLAGGRKLRLIP